jgi:hypothetical protein
MVALSTGDVTSGLNRLESMFSKRAKAASLRIRMTLFSQLLDISGSNVPS